MIYETRTNGKKSNFQTELFKNLLLKSLIFFVIIVNLFIIRTKTKKILLSKNLLRD